MQQQKIKAGSCLKALWNQTLQTVQEELPVRQDVSAAPSVHRGGRRGALHLLVLGRGALQLLVLGRGRALQLLVLGQAGAEDGGDAEQDRGSVGVTQLVDHDGGQNHAQNLQRHRDHRETERSNTSCFFK